MPGDNTLNVGFSINQTSGQPLTVPFSGTLQTKSGVDLSFSFSQHAAGKTISFNVSPIQIRAIHRKRAIQTDRPKRQRLGRPRPVILRWRASCKSNLDGTPA